MKKFTYIFIMIAYISYSCKTEVNINPIEEVQQELLESLQGTWTVVETRKDNTLITDFNDFTLTISGKTYSTENGSPVWPTNGIFDFNSVEIENEFIRQDGRIFTMTKNNDVLMVSILYEENNARGEYGRYEFILE
ncbi:hypothetical protein JKA74_10255 [Marivirga sp. S37H4]|uniref:Lipocalin-like domain-containing protein n=1 Tax=Marivirga aurantiaca TaxID=2802615 RepID=A0A935C8F0_9BACT|nr:hypothetical protein [Marivirga aurantiaca]MBK6265419.1 hypothetical protein [Marivirga aurantiaca]